MNRRIRSLTTTTSSSSSSSPTTKRDEGFYRYLKPGALAQLRNSRIRSHQKHQISLYRVESVASPSTIINNVVHHHHQIGSIEGFPCFTGRIFSPRCPQRKKLVGARSIFFLNSNPSSPVADSPTPLMDVIDLLVSH